MIKKFTNSILVQILVLNIFTVAFFHEAFRMQFWKDDFELLYSLQQNLTIHFPYQHHVHLHTPIFKLFGVNPLAYYSLGVFFVCISTIVFYLLVKKLFSSTRTAFLGSLVYLTSPVGVDTLFETNTFATTFFLLTFLMLILYFFLLYFEKRKLSFYFIAIILFAVALELVPYRTYFFGGIMILFEIIYLRKDLFSAIQKIFYLTFGKWLNVISFKQTVRFTQNDKNFVLHTIFRQLLLISIWFIILYIIPLYFLPDALKYHPERYRVLYKDIVNSELLLNPLLTIINIVFGGIAYIFYRYFYIYNYPIQIVLLISFVICNIYLHLWFKKKNKHLFNIFVFSIGYIYITILALYPYSQREISIASYRYLAITLPAYSIFIVCIFSFLSTIVNNNKKYKLIPICFFVMVFAVNAITKQLYIKDFNTRSYYAVQYGQQLKAFIPNLPKNALIYIKLDEDENVNYRLRDTHRGGIYDERAYYAVLYNMKIDHVNSPIKDKDYSVLLENAKNNSIKKDKIFVFVYGPDGLTDITKNFRRSIGK